VLDISVPGEEDSMRIKAALGLVVVASMLALLPAIQVNAAVSVNGRIAFVTSSSGHFAIFSAEPDGRRIRFLADGTTPSWSPDGRRLAYITESDPTSGIGQIAIRELDGSTVLTGVPAFGLDIYSAPGLSWSPDGTRIAYGFNEEIWVMNAAPPYDPHRVVSRLSSTPSWSPDSEKIAFAGFRPVSGDYEIFTIEADGTGETDITNTPSISEERPDWSPRGGRFAFLAESGSRAGVFLMRADGTRRRFLTPTTAFCCGPPQWSPDGTGIAFVDSALQIATIKTNGTDLAVMNSGCRESFQPAWDERLLGRIPGQPGHWCDR
jgi:Tol biopolymer transport system component